MPYKVGKNKRIALLLLITHCMQHAVSIVYNMRIATITRQQQALSLKADMPHNVVSETPFGQWRTLRNDVKQSSAGSLTSYIYTKPSYYFKVDAAVAHVRNIAPTITIARTQMDDILFTGGYGHPVGNNGRLAYSGLLGIPVHRDFILELAQFGTGHVGLGGQIDGSYTYHNTHKFFAAARFVHFFPATAAIKNRCLQSLYRCCSYDFGLGNLADLLISYQKQWAMNNRIECGYDATFGFGARIKPTITNFSGIASLMRNSFFAVYFRRIKIKDTNTGIIIGISSGFDSKPKLFGNKIVTTLWGTWGISF